jgi:hypothetical protein
VSRWAEAVCATCITLSGSSALGALVSISCPTGTGAGNDPVTVGGASYMLSCGGLKIGGFSSAYFQQFPMTGGPPVPQVDNSVVQLMSATFNIPDSGMPYVEMILGANPPGQGSPPDFGAGNLGVNFTLTGWTGEAISIPQQGSIFAEVTFCRPGHDALGPSFFPPQSIGYAWIGCYDSLGTQFANLAFAGKGSPPIEAGDSPGVTDVSGSQNVIGCLIDQTSASLPPSVTARFWTFGPGTTTVDIQVPTPEPASAALMLAALIALVLLRTTSLPRV